MSERRSVAPPPPAPPSRDAAGAARGGSTVDATADYHLNHAESEKTAERETLNRRLQEIIDGQTEPWGVKVRAVQRILQMK